MNLDRRELMAGAAAAIAFAPGRAAAIPAWPTVQRLLDKYVAERRYAGVAAALSYRGSPIAYLSSGKLAFGSPVDITPDSIFRLYSLTKSVTGIAAMMLIEDGRIELDQPVGEILPALRAMRVAVRPSEGLDSVPATRPMTIRQLLTHTSGMSNWQPFLGDNPISKAYRTRGLTPGSFGAHQRRPGHGPQVRDLNALVDGIAQVPLLAEPGTASNYSLGFDVMAAIVERASGQDFESFMRERIFEPLGMRSTGFRVPPSAATRMTTLYGRTGDTLSIIDPGATSDWLRPPALIAGGGGLASTARDFIRVAAMILGKGELDGRRVIKPETAVLAMSNLLPAGVAIAGNMPGSAAGAAVVLPGQVSDLGPPGTVSAVGASSTMLTIDPSRRGIAVFLAQLNLTGAPPAVATIYRREFNAAVNADLPSVSGRSA